MIGYKKTWIFFKKSTFVKDVKNYNELKKELESLSLPFTIKFTVGHNMHECPENKDEIIKEIKQKISKTGIKIK